ncbi:MAG: helix-turn-helix domain-containing protein [Candidatus Nanopelagicales bacterium]|nr:helix-turn-helix domain-containing protein [Candidatus Nanopelagicales bacterium]
MDTEGLVVDAFAQLGIATQLSPGALDRAGFDLVLDPDGVRAAIHVKRRSLVTEDVADHLLSEILPTDAALLVAADRVTGTARKALTSRRGGYFDLRGRLALRTDRLVIDAEVEPVGERPIRTEALSGKAGLEVATALLLEPERATAVRELARVLGRSPSTVSDILAALRRSGLVDAKNAVAGADLFWRVADRWPVRRTNLARLPTPGDAPLAKALRLGLEDVEHESGWALTDSAAAVAYGAPLALRSDQALDFFVTDESVVRRAASLLGAAGFAARARATVRVAPVSTVVRDRVDLERDDVEWPLAHPLFVALDLAQDVGRGREILDAWTPDDRCTRVW